MGFATEEMREEMRKALERYWERYWGRNKGKKPMDRDLPHRAEPEYAEVAMVKCKKCGHSCTVHDFNFKYFGEPRFCRCKPGEEEIIKTTMEINVAKNVKSLRQ